nr:MAG TPA: hypothetical protein [Caudoviricetes sp.]
MGGGSYAPSPPLLPLFVFFFLFFAPCLGFSFFVEVVDGW